jgi:hypothetical protein
LRWSRPAGGDALGALGAAAIQQQHLRMFRAHLVQRGPDALAVVAVGTASKGDPRPRKQEDRSLAASDEGRGRGSDSSSKGR